LAYKKIEKPGKGEGTKCLQQPKTASGLFVLSFGTRRDTKRHRLRLVSRLDEAEYHPAFHKLPHGSDFL